MKPSRCALILCAIALLATHGCGDPSGAPCFVTGTVSINGEAVEQGNIVFEPQGHGGARGGGAISNGSYEVTVERGMWAGEFLVRINGYRETGETEARFESFEGESSEPVAKLEEIVPAEFNSESTLRVTLSAGENSQDFELTAEDESSEDD